MSENQKKLLPETIQTLQKLQTVNVAISIKMTELESLALLKAGIEAEIRKVLEEKKEGMENVKRS